MVSECTTYLTTPIYYVNDSPHIGHAYTTIATDTMARFCRLRGDSVKFLTGTDEHGQKVDKAAATAGVAPQSFTDEVSQRFRALVHDPLNATGGTNVLNISNTDFIRTTEPRHKKAAIALWQRMEANGFIYKDSYAGWYALRDEAYYQESELTEKDGKKVAVASGAEVEWVTEESYFFKLSAFTEKLLAFYEANPDFVQPQSRMNEVRSFVEGGLKDLSISRTTFNWGIPVPDTSGHVMYVWVDALTNYITSAGYPDESSDEFTSFWGQGSGARGNCTHVVGKDILRFHAVYWPAFLMAADLPLPKQVVAHGWWTREGEKMSKSLGNALSPYDLVAIGGLDVLRYFLMKAMPFGNDGDFSHTRMVETVNADLANNIGNLAQRTLSMIQKHCDGKLPAMAEAELTAEDKALLAKAVACQQEYAAHMAEFGFSHALHSVMSLGSAANEYIDAQAPWTLRKTDIVRMGQVLRVIAETVRHLGVLLLPFTPEAAEKLLASVGVSAAGTRLEAQPMPLHLVCNTPLPAPQPIFPRLEIEKVA